MNCDGQTIICDREDCPKCCTHDDMDHGFCSCGYEADPGAAIDAAEYCFRER